MTHKPDNTGQQTPAAAGPQFESAIRDFRSHLRLWPVAVVGLVLDLWTKHWAFSVLDPNPDPSASMVIIPHVMAFRRSLNAGALFGLGKGLTPIFIAASFLALGFVIFLFKHSGRDRRSLHLALGLVLAGALGNLYDRIFMIADVVTYQVNDRTRTEAFKLIEEREHGIVVGAWPGEEYPHIIMNKYAPKVRQQGVVRDFIKMEPRFTIGGRTIEIWPWVFNVADALLVVGVALLMLNFWWERKAEQAAHRAVMASEGGANRRSGSASLGRDE